MQHIILKRQSQLTLFIVVLTRPKFLDLVFVHLYLSAGRDILPAALARVLEPRVPVKDLSRSHTPDRRLDTAFHCLRQRAGRSSRTLWNNMLQLLLHGLLTVLRLSQRVWLVISTRMPQTQNHVPSMLYRRRRQEKMLRISL